MSQPLLSQACKLMLVSNQHDLRAVHHCLQEMVARRELRPELPDRVHRRVDLSGKLFLCLRQRAHDFAEAYLPYHHHVNVAARSVFTPRHRAVDKRNGNPTADRLKRSPNHIAYAGCFCDQTAELAKNRTGRISLVVNVLPAPKPPQNSRFRKLPQFALNRPKAPADAVPHLTQIKRLFRTPQQQAEHLLACLPEETSGNQI
jgi:hypothetical protein